MKFNQLRDLLAIVEHGSLRAAARRLGVPQPALSRSIRALERDLGAALFSRDARGMTLTASGVLFHQRASAIAHELQKARDELTQLHGVDEGTVVVALSIMPHVQMLPRAFPQFLKRYPKVRLQVIEGLFPDVESGLRNGSIDFYIGAAPHAAPAPGLATQKLLDNTRAVVARKGHPLARSRSLKALSGAQWATTAIDYNAATDLRDLFQSRGLPEPTLALQVRSAMSMMVGLAYSDLLALLPVQWKEFALTRDILQVLPIREVIPAPAIVLVRPPDLPMTPAADHFCDLLRRNLP